MFSLKDLGFTWVRNPFLEGFLEPAHVKRFARHADKGHNLEELFLSRLTQLLDVVTTWDRYRTDGLTSSPPGTGTELMG